MIIGPEPMIRTERMEVSNGIVRFCSLKVTPQKENYYAEKEKSRLFCRDAKLDIFSGFIGRIRKKSHSCQQVGQKFSYAMVLKQRECLKNEYTVSIGTYFAPQT